MTEKPPLPTSHEEGFQLRITDDTSPLFPDEYDRTGLTPLPPTSETPVLAVSETYEELFPTAAKTFMADLARTQATGDAFDMRPSLRKGLRAKLAVPFVVGAELSVVTATLPPVAAATLAAGVGGAVWHNVRTDRKAFSAHFAHENNTAEKTGQLYELYREAPTTDQRQDAAVSLLWYRPEKTLHDQIGPLRSLYHMARMAADNGVQRMHIDKLQYDVLCASINEPPVRDPILRPASEVVQQKNVHLAGRDEIMFACGTPQEWLAFVEQADPRVLEFDSGRRTFAQVVEALRSLQPTHPLLKTVDTYRQAVVDEETQRTYRHKVDGVVQQRLFRQESYPERAKAYKTAGRPYKLHEIIDNEAGHFSDDVRQVRWRTAQSGYVTQDSFAALGITGEQYKACLSIDPDKIPEDPKTVLAALELAIVRDAHGQPLEIEDVAAKRTLTMPAAWSGGDTIQAALANQYNKRESLDKHRRRQAVASAAAIVAIYAALGIAHKIVDVKESNAVEYSRVRIAQERGDAPQFVTDKDAKNYLDGRSTFWKGVHGFERYEDMLNPHWKRIIPDFWSNEQPTGSNMAASSSSGSQVGNTDLPDTPEFTIVSHGGASADGFWEASTSQHLVIQEPAKAVSFGMSWLQTALQTDEMTSSRIPTTLPKQYQHGQNLEVNRKVSQLDAVQLQTKGKMVNTFMMNLPVREGMRPVAAQLDDKPMKLLERLDGTFGIAAQNGQTFSGDLTYWLVPDPGRKARGTAYDLLLSVRSPDGKITDLYDNRLLHSPVLGSAGVRHYNLLQKSSTGKKGEQEIRSDALKLEQQIRSTWDYKFSPIPENDVANWNSLADFEKSALGAKAANCNIANTLVGLRDITSAQVMGYQNHPGSGSDVLSANEAHQKRTDGDATPTPRSPELPPEKPLKLPVSPATLSIIGGGLLVLSQRRRIGRALRKTARYRDAQLQTAYETTRHAEHQARHQALKDRSPTSVAFAYGAAESATFAPTMDAVRIRTASQQMVQATTSSPVDQLLAHDQYPSEAVAETLDAHAAAMAAADGTFAAELRESAAIVRQAHQIRLDRASQPEVMRSSLTRMLDTTQRLSNRTRRSLRKITRRTK